MSIEAISWALRKAPIPPHRRDASSLAIVLVGLANHAGPDGRNAFPSMATLTDYTRLSERAIRYALRALQELDLIRPSDPDIVAAHVKRGDRRPNGYDLALELTHATVDNPVDNSDEGQSVPPVDQHGGQTRPSRGANNDPTRGRPCPRTVLNRPRNPPTYARGAPDRPSTLPPCGYCDARRGDPVTARIVWLDADRTRSVRCPRCHPRAKQSASANGTEDADDHPQRTTHRRRSTHHAGRVDSRPHPTSNPRHSPVPPLPA